jgi:hypothetical protein
MPTNDLTYDKLVAAMREVAHLMPPSQPSLFDFLRPPRYLGMDIYEEPPPPPKIQVRDIKLSDGTSLLSSKFLAETNAWFASEFGYRERLLKDDMAIMWQGGALISPKHAVLLRNMSC